MRIHMDMRTYSDRHTCIPVIFCCKILYLGLIGGATGKEATRRILRKVLTNELACQFNFMGSGEKHAFSALCLKDIVIGMCFFHFILRHCSSKLLLQLDIRDIDNGNLNYVNSCKSFISMEFLSC